ncbi:MAG TPA: hypothetical protein ACFYED_05000, partial [Candidatus Tripitaka californicus]|uniref:hypothetical protein n=1 Tax=Candidatus Tripitaka californicus TaxID=3367616 RepID=UPI004028CE50
MPSSLQPGATPSAILAPGPAPFWCRAGLFSSRTMGLLAERRSWAYWGAMRQTPLAPSRSLAMRAK